MHPSVLEFTQRVLGADEIKGVDVLEVGSYDVNGSVRPYLERLHPRRYLGVDAQPGPGVDRVVDCECLSEQISGKWNVVVSTEMLEHVREWQTCAEELCEMVKPDGLLLITTRSPGFPYHAFPEDHWRFTCDDMKQIMDALGLDVITIEPDHPEYSPGVFVLARKPADWPAGADYRKLDNVDVMVMTG